MNASCRWMRWVLATLAVAGAAPQASADYVAAPEEIRALRDKLAKSPPKPADYAADPYPGAKFDAECSAEATAPQLPEGAAYCFYTLDPRDRVEAYLAAAGKPRNGAVRVTVSDESVVFNGIVKIDQVTMIKYWTNRQAMAYYDSFPASPPPAAELIAPLYPGATYDKNCSAARSLEAKGKPKWREVWCFTANEPYAKVRDAFDLELRSTSNRGVQVDVTDVSATPPMTRIEYWLTTAPPQAAATATPATAATAESPASTTTPTAEPAPAQTDVARKTKEAVDKLRGLFGH